MSLILIGVNKNLAPSVESSKSSTVTALLPPVLCTHRKYPTVPQNSLLYQVHKAKHKRSNFERKTGTYPLFPPINRQKNIEAKCS